MDPISGADRIAALLKQRLLARASGASSGKSQGEAHSVLIRLVSPPAAIGADDDRPRRRMLIQNILSAELDERLANEVEFQQMVDRVLAVIENDKAGSALLSRALQAFSPG